MKIIIRNNHHCIILTSYCIHKLLKAFPLSNILIPVNIGKSIKTVYKFPSPDVCVRETTSYVVSEEGNILENVTTEQLAWEDIPSDVRAELIKLNEEKVVVDARSELEERFKNQIKEQEAVSDKEVLEILA